MCRSFLKVFSNRIFTILEPCNFKIFKIFNTNLHNFMAVNSGKQRFKHAESYARYRACKNFVRFSPSEQKIYNYLSKYFSVVFAG